MGIIKDYFLCDKCKNKDFIRIHNFSVRFRRVNFSENLLYDEVTQEMFQCMHCKKIFSKEQIRTELREMIDEKVKSEAIS